MNYIQLQLKTLSLQQKQNIHGKHLEDDELNFTCCLDDVQPRNRQIIHFKYLLDMDFYHGKLKNGGNEFYWLPADQFQFLQALAKQEFGIVPKQILYRGNTFTADIYLKSFPFIEIKQLTIGVTYE